MSDTSVKSFLETTPVVRVLYHVILRGFALVRRFAKRFVTFAIDPAPWRLRAVRWVVRHSAGYDKRLEWDAVDKPHYGFCIRNAALLAQALGTPKISILEFGVAGGHGLLTVEYHAREVSKETNIEFEIYGFDLGSGLPAPRDYRDLPYHWQGGFYRMDVAELESRLKMAKLVLGDVAETVSTFFDKFDPAPIGCCLFDLDYYSSTADAFGIFKSDPGTRLPRIYSYFDDMIDSPLVAFNAFTGELLAIHEFNRDHTDRKIAKLNGLSWTRRLPQAWNDKIYVFHDFKHPRYGDFISRPDQQRTI